MSLSMADLNRLVLRQPVIGHPFIGLLRKARLDGRVWDIFRGQEAWVQQVWPEAVKILVERLPEEHADLLASIKQTEPIVALNDAKRPDPLEESENYGAWFLDVANRAQEDFAVGALFGLYEARKACFGSLALADLMGHIPVIAIVNPVWSDLLPKRHMQEIYDAVGPACIVMARYFEGLFDECQTYTHPRCQMPTRLVDDTCEKFYCKRCQVDISFAKEAEDAGGTDLGSAGETSEPDGLPGRE